MASQRATTLKAHFDGSKQDLRPILTSLNGDNSWLMSFPCPAAERAKLGKAYYHVVSDAWLAGPAIALSRWLIHLSLPSNPIARDGPDVEKLACEVEEAAASDDIVPGENKPSSSTLHIDAIFVNFHYLDHCHEATLRTFDAKIPIFATAEASAMVHAWKHFDTIITTHDLDPEGESGSWRDLHPGAPLPAWLSVFRLLGHHELNFATAIVWSSDADTHEALLYSPHGICEDQATLQAFLGKMDPSFSVLAILHALKDSFSWGWRTTLGVSGGLALERMAKPKYWVKTHDAPLAYWGLIMLRVIDTFRTLESGLEEEKDLKRDLGFDGLPRKPNLIEVENGGCFVLE
ncbi:uncharacterized protein BCR38DRAFT_363014 [Pseudomassariella vexata]|uniref:Uncharacterized protein n=1 Tax=Pseudomassariella vexata TaxID=1141098 RepID=A0A1Y2EB43_9PEZI|nr:uncharacterized protein BCR38DRAFT_363014 [Pseudomassariella vexata]ORY68524.1 hypothetical protein BCR38DRAFT_363014 [Pseudomassariella vexata]